MATAPLFDLTGKVALVTGSTRGIGRAIVQRLAEHGAKVVVSSRKADATAAVAAQLRAQGHEVLGIPCEVGRKADLKDLVDAILEQWRRIDILVCNAAVNPVYGPSAELGDEAWDKVMTTNVKSIFWLANRVLPQMAARRDGVVLLVSSIAVLTGEAMLGAYAVSKAAEAQLARNLAVEWGKHNIRVNSIAPGVTRTDFAKALWDNPALRQMVEHRTPLGRIGEPDDVAGLAVSLASSACRFVTGQFIIVDGGFSISSTT